MSKMVRSIVCLALLIGALALAGCGESSQTGAVQLELEGWQSSQLEDSPEAVLAVKRADDKSDSLCLVGLDGSISTVWSAPEEFSVSLFDCDPVRKRILVRLSEMGDETFAKVSDHLVVLDSTGDATVLPHRTEEFPYVADGVFTADGAVVWVEMLESMDSIETTLSRAPIDGNPERVLLDGDVPEHHYIWSLDRCIGGEEINVVLKTQGTPATDDDFASLFCVASGDVLTVQGEPYRDDSLFTRSVTDEGVFVFMRNSVHADELVVDLVEVVFTGSSWVERTLISDGAFAPGFEYDTVCGRGPSGTVLVRMATRDQEENAGVLASFEPGSGSLEFTEVGIAEESIDQWIWLGDDGV